MRQSLSPDDLEVQYNNRMRVPDHPQVLARWDKASQVAREGSVCRLDLAYGSGAGETLDVFPAAQQSGAPAPVLVFIHGGYWRALDKAQHSFVAPSFNADGAMVVVPNYALCPAVTVEQIALQMTQALAWTYRHAAQFGGDPGRIAVAGHSAGGHLAAMMLSCRWKEVASDLPVHLVAGALSISGMFDLEPLRLTPSLQTDLQLTPAAVRRLSPAFFPRPKSGRLYATVGAEESDEFLRQNHLIRDVWGPTAVPVCEVLPGKNHFTVMESLADPRGRLHDLALRLVNLR
jgi:arylformamidase